MGDHEDQRIPASLEHLRRDSQELKLRFSSNVLVGSLLATLAATKSGGRLLEIYGGVGIGTAWLLQGMDQGSHLISIERDPQSLEIARRHLGTDPRATFHLANAVEWVSSQQASSFDLILAGTCPVKYGYLEETLSLLKVGGIYVIHDVCPQVNCLDDQNTKLKALTAELENRDDLSMTAMNWSGGIIIAAKRDNAVTKCFHRSF